MFSAFFKACSLSRTSLLYRMPSSLSTTFFNFFRSVFLSISMRAIASFYIVFCCLRLSDSLIILPKILPLVNGFLHLFCLFSISFLRGFCGLSQERGSAEPYPLQTLASSPLQKASQEPRNSENIDGRLSIIMYENLGSGSESLQKSGFFHIPHTCPTALWYIIVRNGRKKYGQIKNDIKG